MSIYSDLQINDQYKKLESEIDSLQTSVMESQIINTLNLNWDSIFNDIYSNQEEKFLLKQNINELKQIKSQNNEKQYILNQLQDALTINQIHKDSIKNTFLKKLDVKQVIQHQQLQLKKVQMENLKLKQKISKYKLKKKQNQNLQNIIKQKDDLIQNLNIQIYQYNQININNEEKIKNLQNQIQNNNSLQNSNILFSNIRSPLQNKKKELETSKLIQICIIQLFTAQQIKKENDNPNTKRDNLQDISQSRYSMIQKPDQILKIQNFDEHIKLCKSDFKKKSNDKIQQNEEIKINQDFQDSMQNLVLNQDQIFQSDFEKDDDIGCTGSPQINKTSKSLYKAMIK